MSMTRSRLAVDGGVPVRSTMLPYGRQTIEDADEQAVLSVLRSGWLTSGPAVGRFEQAFAARAGARYAVALANGTAALHAAMTAANISAGDEVLVPAITFVASANAAVFVGARPVFVDVDPDTLLIDPASARARVTERTRALVGVDYAGQPVDWRGFDWLTGHGDVTRIADACHALGATDRGRLVGSLADLTTFSLHPVKHVTAGEGGVVTTNDPGAADRMRRFRNHGISRDFRARAVAATWEYEVVDLGYNYRLSDIQCGLAEAQLGRLDEWLDRRRTIAASYDKAFANLPGIRPLRKRADIEHAYHLYVVRMDESLVGADRRTIFQALRAENIGVNVHYLPVHLHPFYRQRFGTAPGDCPHAEAAYNEILTLPLYHGMTDADASDVIEAVWKVVETYRARSGASRPTTPPDVSVSSPS